jgi:hypothetical protein
MGAAAFADFGALADFDFAGFDLAGLGLESLAGLPDFTVFLADLAVARGADFFTA